MSLGLTGNPFASTHSLSTDPFADADPDPVPREDEDLKQEIRKRDAAIEDLQTKLANMRQPPRNNWPPFFPLIYHSIPDEIPEASQPIIKRIYMLWLVLLVALVVNMISCIFVLVAGSSEGGRDLGSSIGYIPVIGILSFLLWYRPVYNAYMKEQALYYYFYFFFCGWHLVFSIYMIVGIPGTGSAGLIQMVQMYLHGHIVAGILSTIATIGWVIQGLGNAIYYYKIWMHKTAQGHTVSDAKADLASRWAKGMFSRGG